MTSREDEKTQTLSILEDPFEERDRKFGEQRANVGEGWYRILDELHENLSALLGDYTVHQIKEQYGGLRCYILLDQRAPMTNRMQALYAIADAERESLMTCEGCGEPGSSEYHAGWYKTLCPRHHAELEEVMTAAAKVAAKQWLGVKGV